MGQGNIAAPSMGVMGGSGILGLLASCVCMGIIFFLH